MGGLAKPFSKEAALKRALRSHLKRLGFVKDVKGELVLPGSSKDVIRTMHRDQRRERFEAASKFLERKLSTVLPYFADGSELSPEHIRLSLRIVTSGSLEADIFRAAALTWSVPVSPGFGRRMRYLVWDEGHDRLAGIVALGDPVFNLKVRDSLVDWTVHDRSARLVGILDAYVLGAVPPYNALLGGKAVACLIRSRDVYDDFARTYGDTVGVIANKAKNARLLAVTTTSSMGRSSVYNRLKLGSTQYFEAIGFTLGWGHFHITDDLFEQMRDFLRNRDHRYADQHTFGQGPNWRLRTIKAALAELKFDEGILKHGIKRQVFIARMATNAFEILRTGVGEPDIDDLKTVSEISDLALQRWIMPRAERGEIDFASWRRSMIPSLITGSMSLRTQDERKLG